MNPASRVISICGSGDFSRGVAIISDITGADRSRVHRWTYPKERGGTGGVIPSQHQQRILDWARENDVPLRPEHFFEVAA
jgi:hypothetical protein